MRTALVGSKAIGLAAARYLADASDLAAVVTLDDSGDIRSELSAFGALDNVTVASTPSEANHAMRDADVDFILVAGWYWRVPPSVLNRQPVVGIHHSLLPAYRGGSPLVWALMNGGRVGTSLFTLTKGEMDAGPIWGQREVDAGGGYIGPVLERCNAAALDLVARLLDPAAQPVEQEHAAATWCALRNPADGLVDWRQPADELIRFIRAQSRPYPGAFTYAGDEKVTLWRASAVDMTYYGSPGQVVEDLVICGDSRPLRVEEASTPISGRLGRAGV